MLNCGSIVVILTCETGVVDCCPLVPIDDEVDEGTDVVEKLPGGGDVAFVLVVLLFSLQEQWNFIAAS
jgi:hypothetical protein